MLFDLRDSLILIIFHFTCLTLIIFFLIYYTISEKYQEMPATKAIDKIPEVENGMSINELIKEFNGIISEWTDIYKPITSGRTKTLDSCDMGKKSGATI